MKGYVVENGYMGYLDGKYVLFADESDYEEVYEEQLNVTVHAVPEHRRETMKLH